MLLTPWVLLVLVVVVALVLGPSKAGEVGRDFGHLRRQWRDATRELHAAMGRRPEVCEVRLHAVDGRGLPLQSIHEVPRAVPSFRLAEDVAAQVEDVDPTAPPPVHPA